MATKLVNKSTELTKQPRGAGRHNDVLWPLWPLWPPIRGKLAPLFWGGAPPPFSALPSDQRPYPTTFLPRGLTFPSCCSQESKVNWDELTAVWFGLSAWTLVTRGWRTYIADISHVPLVLPKTPCHVDIGGRSRDGGVGAAVARQAVAHHPCQDGEEGPGQVAHPCDSLLTSLTCSYWAHIPPHHQSSPNLRKLLTTSHTHTVSGPHMTVARLACDWGGGERASALCAPHQLCQWCRVVSSVVQRLLQWCRVVSSSTLQPGRGLHSQLCAATIVIGHQCRILAHTECMHEAHTSIIWHCVSNQFVLRSNTKI